MKVVRFFAADDDLLNALTAVEQVVPLQYLTTSGPPAHRVSRYLKSSDLPDMGRASHDAAIACRSFLVAAQDAHLSPRRVTLVGGTTIDAYDQLVNEEAATLTPAGRWGKEMILYGTFGTTHASAAASRLVNAFSRSIRKEFTKVKAYWVGPEAMRALLEGARLTLAAQSPREFDLKFE